MEIFLTCSWEHIPLVREKGFHSSEFSGLYDHFYDHCHRREWNKAEIEGLTHSLSPIEAYSDQKWRSSPGAFSVHTQYAVPDFSLRLSPGQVSLEVIKSLKLKFRSLSQIQWYFKLWFPFLIPGLKLNFLINKLYFLGQI